MTDTGSQGQGSGAARLPADAAPADAGPATDGLLGWPWVLVVFGVFLALGALWFALFGAPMRIGSEGGASPASSSGSSVSSNSVGVGALTLADVQDVLSRLDYVETSDDPQTEYDNAMHSVVVGVNLGDFAAASLAGTEPVVWTPTPGEGAVAVTGAEKTAIVAEAIQTFTALEEASGTPLALQAVMETRMDPGGALSKTRTGALLAVVAQGLSPLGLMFGAQDLDNDWTWRVEDARITGPDTAVLTYSAATTPGAAWHFVDPNVRYQKTLWFARDSSGKWMLTAWPDAPTFEAEFRANIAPAGSTVISDEWWGSL